MAVKKVASASARERVAPTFDEENALWGAGYAHVAGVDEAGRGALAGPVVAAAVVAPTHARLQGVWAKVRDSKLLRPAERLSLVAPIQEAALGWGVGFSPASLIDEVGIATATRMAMLQALGALQVKPDYLLIDWVKLPQAGLPQLCVPKADLKMASVAAASILAKVTRDQLLEELGVQYPGYGFAEHKGYGTAQHLAALTTQGPCAEHRYSFAPLSQRFVSRTLWSVTNDVPSQESPAK